MARFSRLRLSCLHGSARLLLLAAGFGGMSAAPAFAEVNALATTKVMQTGKTVAFDAYISGFKTLLKTADAQTEQVQLPLKGGTIPWQVVLAQQAKRGEVVINCRFDIQSSLAKTVCEQLSVNCFDTARAIDLELLSLKFRAAEMIEAATLAHGRELAFNTELVASVAHQLTTPSHAALTPVVQLPTFAFTTVTTTVTVPDGGTGLISAKKFDRPASQDTIAWIEVAETASNLVSILLQELTEDQALQDKIKHLGEHDIGVPVEGHPRLFKRVGHMELMNATHAEIAGIQASRHLMKAASSIPAVPLHVANDGLGRIGVDFELNLELGNGSPIIVTPRTIIEEEEELLLGNITFNAPTVRALASPVPSHSNEEEIQGEFPQNSLKSRLQAARHANQQTLSALIMNEGAAGARKFYGIQNSPAELAAETVHQTTASCYQALLDMPFSMDKLLTLQVEISPLQEPCLPGITGCFGPTPSASPTLRMSALTQERMFRHFAPRAEVETECPPAAPGMLWCHPEIDAEAIKSIEAKYEFPEIQTWMNLHVSRTAAPVVNDAAPLDNPPTETNLADYMPHLPAGNDAPTENPELEASAAVVVSATMAPNEYLAAFQDRIAAQQEQSGAVVPVTHYEMIQASDSPALRALGGPISVAPCESETCRGFTIQFAPLGQPAAEAEAHVFDGPAQIKLCDTSGTDSGTVEPAVSEESPREESLDEIAARLQRQFLARAMSGEFDQPGACPAENCQPCPAEKSAAKTCPPCGIADCPGCPAGSPCCAPAALPTLSAPPVHARSQWTLPTPAVTYNPYAQAALPQHGPGYGAVLPRDCDFYFRSPMEVPVGPPCGPAPAAYGTPPTATTFAAPPQMVYQPQPARPEYSAANSPYPGVHAAAAPAARLPISHESLETHREISRTLDQLAERCESQGMYDKADQLRELARENRMSARAIHGQLSTMPVPMPYAVPAGYYPEMGPMMLPPGVNPPLNPPMNPVPAPALPIAQPIMVPRY